MPTPQELAQKSKEQLAEEERRKAIRDYYDCAKMYLTCPVGDNTRRYMYLKLARTAERKMQKLFQDADERMRSLSMKAYRGEAI